MNKKCYVVFTTINPPSIARDYCQNFEKFGHKNEVGLIIIGDRKSPVVESKQIAAELKMQGFDVDFFDVAEQDAWLGRFPGLKEIIPYNSDNRRNVGFLMALERGCEFIISVDDDNFPLPDVDFFALHNILGRYHTLPVLETESKWFNICSLLEHDGGDTTLYPRGYPHKKRRKPNAVTETRKQVPIFLNQGLWLHDPDVDSISRIHHDVKITRFSGRHIALELGTWSPINTQNTSVHRDILPAYYFVPMRHRLGELTIDRYGDIWAGLFTKKVMDAMNVYASFGNPIAKHIRNTHNLFKDLHEELGCIIYTEVLADMIENMELKGRNAIELYADLADKLLKSAEQDPGLSDDFKTYIQKLNFNQHIWLEAITRIIK